MQRAPIRVSFINFLNSAPLGWGFLQGSLQGRFEVLFDVPSACARRLAAGEADAGLIPVIEYQRIADLEVVPAISVSSTQEVKSVLCVARRPLESVRSVALDTASRTSAALLKILLAHHFSNPEVEFTEAPSGDLEDLGAWDAVLIIGNPALKVDRSDLLVYDLAREWRRFSGLPFVFAFWAARAESARSAPELGSWLLKSKEEGLAALERIARESASSLGLDPKETLSYLSTNLNYDLGPDHLRALEYFYDLAAEMELIAGRRPLQWIGTDPVCI